MDECWWIWNKPTLQQEQEQWWVLDHIPTDMHCNGRAARMSGPAMILGIENAMTKARIGHFVKQVMRDWLHWWERHRYACKSLILRISPTWNMALDSTWINAIRYNLANMIVLESNKKNDNVYMYVGWFFCNIWRYSFGFSSCHVYQALTVFFFHFPPLFLSVVLVLILAGTVFFLEQEKYILKTRFFFFPFAWCAHSSDSCTCFVLHQNLEKHAWDCPLCPVCEWFCAHFNCRNF